jgi:orotate phosphoribosyltransferase
METRSREVASRTQPMITMQVTPGHFATRNSHINYYIDLTDIKCQHTVARQAGQQLAAYYDQTPVDSIVCLEGTEALGAYLAASLSDQNSHTINSKAKIAILTPEINVSSQMMFRDNVQHMIWERNVLLLVASATTGTTINQAMDAINYYGGRTNGIAAIFSAISSMGDLPVRSIFSVKDVPGYATFLPADCPDCRAKRKIDALVNSFGYSKL